MRPSIKTEQNEGSNRAELPRGSSLDRVVIGNFGTPLVHSCYGNNWDIAGNRWV